jgi:hypothetical protein
LELHEVLKVGIAIAIEIALRTTREDKHRVTASHTFGVAVRKAPTSMTTT